MDVGATDPAWRLVREQMQQAWRSSADSNPVDGWDRVILSLLSDPGAIVELLRLSAADEAALLQEALRDFRRWEED